MKAICYLDVLMDSKDPKYSSPTKKVPQGKKPRARSRLGRKQSSKHISESTIEASKSQSSRSKKETKSSLAMDTSPSYLSPPTLMVGEMYEEVQQEAGGLSSLGDTSKDGAHPQLSSDMSAFPRIKHSSSTSFILHSESASGHDALADFTAEADPGIYKTKSAGDMFKTAHTTSSANEESRADDISRNVKLEDLEDILKDTRSAFYTPNSPTDEPIIILDVHLLQSQKKELEQEKVTTEVASVKAKPLYPDINQLTKHLVTSLKPKLSKLLASHDFASCLPTELKELPSKIIGLSRAIKELKQHIKDMEIKIPRDLNEILFATLVENASGAISTGVTSEDKAITSPTEGEKDADINLKNELVDLLGIDIVTQYYNKNLLYERYCKKIKKRRQSSKIINCDVLTKKGPISLKKVYKAGKRLLYAKRNKAISLGKGAFKVSREVHLLFLKGLYLTESSNGLQPKQADLSYVHASNKLHLHEIRVVPSKHEANQCGSLSAPERIALSARVVIKKFVC
uniref:Uncharacterized protein n=1 Tax=Tanacetum cinerariifolium TaxID=118510 RepID=A0A6L2KH73_TANCI|nr:hypothetical protein [Tanacetum cinerariifolium]